MDYSPIQSDVNSLWDKYIHQAKTLSDDDAEWVYLAVYGIGHESETLQRLIYLYSVLEKESARGKRCSVCLKVDDSSCIEGC